MNGPEAMEPNPEVWPGETEHRHGEKLWENYGKLWKTMVFSMSCCCFFLFYLWFGASFSFWSHIIFPIHFPTMIKFGVCVSHSERNDQTGY